MGCIAFELSFTGAESTRLAHVRFPLGLWAAPKRIPEAAAGAEEAGERGTPPWWPDVYGLPGLPLLQFTWSWSWWYPRD